MDEIASLNRGARRAPPGFTPEQWSRFERDGFLIVENALAQAEIDRYLAAIDRTAAHDPTFSPAAFYSPQNVVERDTTFEELIDHPSHIGYVWDVYGELAKLHLSQFMIRPPNSWHNRWHPDGARALPYGVFAPRLPMQLKVGYWLTDLPDSRMGNLVVMPGSHRTQYFAHYDTHDSVPGEHIVCVKRGTMTLMHCNTWHRVEPNESDRVRKNVFFSFAPSWVVAEDRYTSSSDWLKTLTRERRILMRSYGHPYTNTKPPREDFPLYLDRVDGSDRDPGMYQDHVELHRRKRTTTVERWLAAEAFS